MGGYFNDSSYNSGWKPVLRENELNEKPISTEEDFILSETALNNLSDKLNDIHKSILELKDLVIDTINIEKKGHNSKILEWFNKLFKNKK